MSSDSTLPRTLSAVGYLAVLAVLLALVGTVASLATVNSLLAGSPWQVPALVTVGIATVSLVLFAVAGKPSGRWRRTPYW